MSEGVVPDEFNLKNYRPVSGLGFISKLVERVVVSQLNDHVSLIGLENVRQSAYKLGHCFQLRMMFIWLLLKVRLLLSFSWINQQRSILLTMIRFLILLAWFDVGGVVLDWFKSYVSDHVQCIKIESILSDAKKLLYGVPQGSVLGPLLFSLYTTPLSKVIQNHPGISFHF